MAKKKESLHSPIDDLIFNFEVPGRSIVALYNAVGFTLAHKDEYIKEAENCEYCFEAMRILNSYFWNLIENHEKAKDFQKPKN